jgi:phenylalanyl-tRNA synthetase beta subunit
LRYRAADRTLTEAEINTAHEQVTAMLGREFGAELR